MSAPTGRAPLRAGPVPRPPPPPTAPVIPVGLSNGGATGTMWAAGALPSCAMQPSSFLQSPMWICISCSLPILPMWMHQLHALSLTASTVHLGADQPLLSSPRWSALSTRIIKWTHVESTLSATFPSVKNHAPSHQLPCICALPHQLHLRSSRTLHLEQNPRVLAIPCLRYAMVVCLLVSQAVMSKMSNNKAA